jgi:hypothetical protein
MDPVDEAYQKFCVERFPAVSIEQIQDLEASINVHFADAYRYYLLAYNGGSFTYAKLLFPRERPGNEYLRFMNGIGTSHRATELGRKFDINLFDDNDPPQIVPIGSTWTNGLILLTTYGTDDEDDGKIIFKKEFGDFYFLADDIKQFFAGLEVPEEMR